MDIDIIHEGNLIKLGFNSGKWQRRWVELQGAPDPMLFYYAEKTAGAEWFNGANCKNGTNKKEKGCVVIDKDCECAMASAGAAPSEASLGKGASPKKAIPDHCFHLTAPWKKGRRTFYFAAETAGEAASWCEALQQTTSSLTATRHADGPVFGLAAQLREQQLEAEQVDMYAGLRRDPASPVDGADYYMLEPETHIDGDGDGDDGASRPASGGAGSPPPMASERSTATGDRSLPQTPSPPAHVVSPAERQQAENMLEMINDEFGSQERIFKRDSPPEIIDPL